MLKRVAVVAAAIAFAGTFLAAIVASSLDSARGAEVTPQKPAIDYTLTENIAQILQASSGIGALLYCHDYGMLKDDLPVRKAYNRVAAIFDKYPDDDDMKSLSRDGMMILQGSRAQGIWVIALVKDGKITGTRIEIDDPNKCAAVVVYFENLYKPGALLDLVGRGEMEATR